MSSSHPIIHHFENNEHVADLAPQVEELFTQLTFEVEQMDEDTAHDLRLLSRNVSPPRALVFNDRIVGPFWKIYRFQAEGVAYLLSNRQNISPETGLPPAWSHMSILSPCFRFDLVDEAVDRHVLVHPDFFTLQEYLVHNAAQDCLPRILRNYIMGLYEIHDMGFHIGEIAEENLVVYKDKWMYLRPTSATARIRTPDEFMKLGRVLHNCFQIYGWYQTGGPVYVIVQHLIKSDNYHKCQWMKYAPYILTSDEKVRSFIPKMNDIAKVCQSFNIRLRMVGIGLITEVLAFGNAELTSGINNVNYAPARGWFNNCSDCLKFLRNSTGHLHDVVSRPRLNQSNIQTKGTIHSDYSNLLLDSSEFVRLMNTFTQADFLNSVFKCARFYACLAESENTTFMR